MRRIFVFRLLSMAGISASSMFMAGMATATPQYRSTAGYQAGQVVRCESINNRNRQCQIVTNGGVRLVRQLSGTPCIEGQTWGFNSGRLWVSQGCRGDFVASGGYGSNRYGSNGYGDGGYGNAGQVLRCESTDGRLRQCAMDARGRIELVRQVSDSDCVEGRTWGQYQGGVWVNKGCRADFRSVGGWGGGTVPTQTIRCESVDNRYQQCNVDTRRGARLQRQLSGTSCIEGQTWGVNRDGVWVNNGCRAEFAIGYRGGGNRVDQPYEQSVRSVRCESSDGRPNRCNLPIRGGVRLQRQISDTRCQQGDNWGWDRDGVWVTGGCRAEFSVW